ncbi:MAG TPA: hypothetical protein VKA94_07065 [Hyphomicrobiales bacterium]|nr:hypothetical protein [Hyphomicrobiales bacterium]
MSEYAEAAILAGSFLSYIDENRGEEEPASRAKVLMRLFPDLPEKRAKDLVCGLETLAAFAGT